MTYSDAMLYVEPFFVGIIMSAILCAGAISVAKRIRLYDKRTTQRHMHAKNISRFGGVAIIISFLITLIINRALIFDHTVWALFFGGSIILLFGLIDDLRPLSWRSQLFFQIVIVMGVFIIGIRVPYITNPFGGVIWLGVENGSILCLIFMIGWMLFIMNAINWCDGIDGLSGGVIAIAACALFALTLQPHVMQPPMAIIAMALMGSVVGFLLFNFPPAKILAGSSGAFFMGFVIAVVAIAAGAKIGTTLLVLIIPLLDSLWVVWNRLKKGRSIFHGDKEHLHFKLIDRGWSVKQILLFYYGITALCAFFAVWTRSTEKLFTFVFLCIVMLIMFFFFSYDKKNVLTH